MNVVLTITAILASALLAQIIYSKLLLPMSSILSYTTLVLGAANGVMLGILLLDLNNFFAMLLTGFIAASATTIAIERINLIPD